MRRVHQDLHERSQLGESREKQEAPASGLEVRVPKISMAVPELMFSRLRKQMLSEEPIMSQGQTPASSDDEIEDGSLDPVAATTSDIEDDLKDLSMLDEMSSGM